MDYLSECKHVTKFKKWKVFRIKSENLSSAPNVNQFFVVSDMTKKVYCCKSVTFPIRAFFPKSFFARIEKFVNPTGQLNSVVF